MWVATERIQCHARIHKLQKMRTHQEWERKFRLLNKRWQQVKVGKKFKLTESLSWQKFLAGGKFRLAEALSW